MDGFSHAVKAGLAGDGVAGGVGQFEEVFSDGGESDGVGKAVQLQAADVDGVVLAGYFYAYAAVLDRKSVV